MRYAWKNSCNRLQPEPHSQSCRHFKALKVATPTAHCGVKPVLYQHFIFMTFSIPKPASATTMIISTRCFGSPTFQASPSNAPERTQGLNPVSITTSIPRLETQLNHIAPPLCLTTSLQLFLLSFVSIYTIEHTCSIFSISAFQQNMYTI